MTSDARVVELIREHFSEEWPRLCPDSTYAIAGRPEPQDQVFVHLEVGAIERWVYLRCWVPRVLQLDGTLILHGAARQVFERRRIASDDGTIAFGEGARIDIGKDGPLGRWWMSAISFPFKLGA